MMKYGRRFFALASLSLVVAVVAMCQQQAHAQVMERILKEKKIKVGWIPSPPGAMKDLKTGEIVGYYVDGLRYMFKTIHVEPELVETTWANFAAGLQSGQFDLSIAGTFATIQRAASVEFTKPIFYLGYSAIVKKGDTRFKKLSDLNQKGIKIAVILGGAGEEYVKEHFPEATMATLATGNLTAPFVEVSAGRADVGIEDATQAHRYAQQQPGVTDLFENNPYDVLPIAWSVKRGNQDLLNFLNTSIDYMLFTEKWQHMSEKYGATGRFYNKPQLAPFGMEGQPKK
jgi:ABC-type amino acid transport substrate-binding protein